MAQQTPSFSVIATENEEAAEQALARGDFAEALLRVHSLMEGLLRLFLRVPEAEEVSFNDLIQRYQAHLEDVRYTVPSFMHELAHLNRRRSEILHRLWRRGLSFTNEQAEPAARAAVAMCGMFIDWLESFDADVTGVGEDAGPA